MFTYTDSKCIIWSDLSKNYIMSLKEVLKFKNEFEDFEDAIDRISKHLIQMYGEVQNFGEQPKKKVSIHLNFLMKKM